LKPHIDDLSREIAVALRKVHSGFADPYNDNIGANGHVAAGIFTRQNNSVHCTTPSSSDSNILPTNDDIEWQDIHADVDASIINQSQTKGSLRSYFESVSSVTIVWQKIVNDVDHARQVSDWIADS